MTEMDLYWQIAWYLDKGMGDKEEIIEDIRFAFDKGEIGWDKYSLYLKLLQETD